MQTKEEKRIYDKKRYETNKNNPEFVKKKKESNKKYYKNNPEKIKAYQEQNKEKRKVYMIGYQKQNKEKTNKLRSERRKTDPNFKIITSLRSQQNRAIKRNQKTGSTIDYLGCSIEYFKKYIEDQFVEGMSWDNWSMDGFHLDHQIPLSIVDLNDESDLRHVLHYTNLQPMFASENIRKSNKLTR